MGHGGRATSAVVPFLSNDALPALERATSDADATVVLAAKQAIEQIGASSTLRK